MKISRQIIASLMRLTSKIRRSLYCQSCLIVENGCIIYTNNILVEPRSLSEWRIPSFKLTSRISHCRQVLILKTSYLTHPRGVLNCFLAGVSNVTRDSWCVKRNSIFVISLLIVLTAEKKESSVSQSGMRNF